MDHKGWKRLRLKGSLSRSKESKSVHIPQEIVENIITRLPLASLARFECVCKAWCSSISNLMYQNQSVVSIFEYSARRYSYTMSYEGTSTEKFLPVPWNNSRAFFDLGDSEIYVSNSCNGMVLICIGICFYLFNPSTHYFVKVLTLNYYQVRNEHGTWYNDTTGYRLHIGFYYDETISDYKAVELIRLSFIRKRKPSDDILVEASLKGKQWNHLYNTFEAYNGITVGPLVNGRLHWLYYDEVARFNPVLKVFEDLPSFQPPRSRTKHCEIIGIGILIGCLCVSRIVNRHDAEILAMKEYGVSKSWTPIFSFSDKQLENMWLLNPLLLTRAGEFWFSVRNEVWVYNPGEKSFKKYITPDKETSTVSFVPNMDTPTGYYWDQTEHEHFENTADSERMVKFRKKSR